MKLFKTLVLSLLLLFTVVGVMAQPSPPHEIYGNVDDQGSAAQGITVEADTGSNTYSDSTDSNGYYEIKIPSDKSSFDIVVDGNTEETGISVQSGKIEKYDFSGDYIEDGNNNPDCGEGEEYDSDEEECVSTEDDTQLGQETEENQQEEENQEDNQQQEEVSQEPEQEVNQTVEVQAEKDENNRTTVSVNASAGQTVKVNFQQEQQEEEVGQGQEGSEEGSEEETGSDDSGGSSVNSISATASDDTSISVSVSDVSEDEVEEPLEDQIDYSNIEVDGEVSSQTIEFSVQKSRLQERDADPEQVVQERYSNGEWNQLDTEYISEGDSSYNFEAETGGNSIFAVSILEKEANIKVTDVDTDVNGTEQELPVERNISVKVQNRGLGNGSKQVNISADGEVIHQETVELEGKEDVRISTTHRFDSGSVDISAGSITETVSIDPVQSDSSLPLGLISAALLVLLVAGTLVYRKEKVSDFVESLMTGTDSHKVEDLEFEGADPDSDLECDLCGKSFESVRGLETHHGEVHDEHVFECEVCGDVFDTKRGLHIHQGKEHGEEEVEVLTGFECGICEKVFDSEKGLHIHHGKVHDDEKYRCSECGREFNSREQLHNHQKKH